MPTIDIQFNIPFFRIDKVEETDTAIFIYGQTEETSVGCHICGKETARFHGYDKERKVRHLPIMNKQTYLIYQPKRYICFEHGCHCPTTTATPDFHSSDSQFSYELELYLLRELVNSTVKDVALKNDTTEKKIEGIINRHISPKINWSQFKFLGDLGIDEISLEKGKGAYMTIITARINGKVRILSIIKGRKKRDIKHFLLSIPIKLRKTVVSVCTDMYKGYVNAAREVFTPMQVIVDRYHVAKLYRRALDKMRQKVLADLKKELPPHKYDKVKNLTNLLRGHKEFFTKEENEKLNTLFSYSFELTESYRMARKLTSIFNKEQSIKSGTKSIDAWIQEVQSKKINCFKKFIKTLKAFKVEICNYFSEGKNSGFVEGFNNKIKVLKRRCYGIFDPKTLFKRLYIDINGYELYSINIG